MFAILLMEGKGWIGGKFGGLSDASVASPYK